MIIFLPKNGSDLSNWNDEPFTKFLIPALLGFLPTMVIHGILRMDSLWPVSVVCVAIGFVVGLIRGK